MANTFKLNEEDIRAKSQIGYASLTNIANKLCSVNSKIKKAYDLINDCNEIGSVYYEPNR